jgi:hypothetical protein
MAPQIEPGIQNSAALQRSWRRPSRRNLANQNFSCIQLRAVVAHVKKGYTNIGMTGSTCHRAAGLKGLTPGSYVELTLTVRSTSGQLCLARSRGGRLWIQAKQGCHSIEYNCGSTQLKLSIKFHNSSPNDSRDQNNRYLEPITYDHDGSDP